MKANMIIGLDESFAIAHLMPKWNLDQFLPDSDDRKVYVRDNSRQVASVFSMNDSVNFFSKNRHSGMPALMPHAWAILQWAVSESPFNGEMAEWWTEQIGKMPTTPKSNAYIMQMMWMTKVYELAIKHGMIVPIELDVDEEE